MIVWECDSGYLLHQVNGMKAVKVALSATHCAFITQDGNLYMFELKEGQAVSKEDLVPVLDKVHSVSLGWGFALATRMEE